MLGDLPSSRHVGREETALHRDAPDDLFRYLEGAGYATIDSFEVGRHHPCGWTTVGSALTESIWATSTQGSGQQTLRWDSEGDWSLVFMNADAASGGG